MKRIERRGGTSPVETSDRHETISGMCEVKPRERIAEKRMAPARAGAIESGPEPVSSPLASITAKIGLPLWLLLGAAAYAWVRVRKRQGLGGTTDDGRSRR